MSCVLGGVLFLFWPHTISASFELADMGSQSLRKKTVAPKQPLLVHQHPYLGSEPLCDWLLDDSGNIKGKTLNPK